MKVKPKYLLITTIFVLLLISLTTLSYATTNLQVSDINVTVSKSKAEVTWSKDTKADGYDVYVDFPQIGYQYIGTVTNNKVQIIGFEENQMYAVKIKAYKYEGNGTIYSEFSPEAKFKIGDDLQITSDVGNVTSIKATVANNGSYGTVEWSKAKNADGYEIYASIGNNNFSYLGDTEENLVKVIGIREGVIYKIKVQPYKIANGKRIYGSFSNTVIMEYEEKVEQNVKIAKVTGLNIEMNGNNANLTWNKVNNADGYEIQVKLTGNVDATYDTEKTNITLNNFTEGYTYVTKVRAYKYVNGEKVYGEYSASKNIVYEPEIEVDRVTGLKIDIDENKVTFNWNKVKNADGYEVKIYTPSGETKTYITSYAYKTLGFTNYNEEYSVKVRAYEYVKGKKVYGDYSSREYFEVEKIEVDKVKGLDVRVDGTTARFSWDRVSGADGYEMKIYTPSNGTKTYTTTSTSKTMTGFTDTSGEYSVKVRAYEYVKGKKVYGDYSSREYFESEKVEVDRVKGLEVKRSGQAARFSWDRVSGADGYEIVIKIPGIGDCRYSETATSRYMTGFTETRYKYTIKVRAYEYINGRKVYGDYSKTVYF